jgi:hypothetical protein
MRALGDLIGLFAASVARRTRSALTDRTAPTAEQTNDNDGGPATEIRLTPLGKTPFSVPPADTPYQYAFPFSEFVGRAGSALPGLRARQRLRYGRVVSPELQGDEAAED